MNRRSFDLHQPEERTTSAIFASPHSGRDYPWSFMRRSVLDERTIRSSEDAFIDQIFGHATQCGAPLLAARAPRAYVDLNRAPDELDPALIEDVARQGHNPRVGSGLGVIPRVVSNGRAIYRGKIARGEAEERLAEVWHPYHDCLAQLLAESCEMFGQAVLMAGVPLGVIDMRASLATLHVQKSVLLLMAAMLVDRRFGVASLAFALAYLLFVPLEPWRAEVSAVAHGTISVVAAWIWWPRGEA